MISDGKVSEMLQFLSGGSSSKSSSGNGTNTSSLTASKKSVPKIASNFSDKQKLETDPEGSSSIQFKGYSVSDLQAPEKPSVELGTRRLHVSVIRGKDDVVTLDAYSAQYTQDGKMLPVRRRKDEFGKVVKDESGWPVWEYYNLDDERLR